MSDKNNITIKCNECNKEKVLSGLAAWSYIIMKYTICEYCKFKIEWKEIK